MDATADTFDLHTSELGIPIANGIAEVEEIVIPARTKMQAVSTITPLPIPLAERYKELRRKRRINFIKDNLGILLIGAASLWMISTLMVLFIH